MSLHSLVRPLKILWATVLAVGFTICCVGIAVEEWINTTGIKKRQAK